MYQPFDVFEYVEYLRRRWRTVTIACGIAGLVVLVVSLLLPKYYTAVASIVIEPPGGADVRAATSVSPIYLESLKTYERFAESDTLFARAAAHSHLQEAAGAPSIESIKRRALKVSKIRDTKILEIRVTLKDPKLAQSLAQFIAEETVNTSRSTSVAADRDPIDDAQRQADQAQLRREQTQKALLEFAASAPVESLQSEIDSNVELQGKLKQQLVEIEANIAEYQQAQGNGQFAKEQLQAAQARASLLEKRLQELARTIQQKGAVLANRSAKRDELQSNARLADKAYETSSARLRELQATAGMHSERLRILDPGVIPQAPSSPNVSLNVAAALFLALIASIVYLSLAFAFRRKALEFEPSVSRGMRA